MFEKDNHHHHHPNRDDSNQMLSIDGFNSQIHRIEEEDYSKNDVDRSLDQSDFILSKVQRYIIGLRRDIVDSFSKRVDEMDFKFSAEIAKINNIIETELGIPEEPEGMKEGYESEKESAASVSEGSASRKQSADVKLSKINS